MRKKAGWLAKAAVIVPCCVLTSFSVPAWARSSTVITEAARLPQAEIDGNYFVRDGHRFMVIGAHWVPAKAAMQWPLQWDAKDIEADFAKMKEMGFNTVRFDLMWAWFEPRPGDYNPQAFEQFDHLIKLAHKYHIYLHPTLFVGGEVGEAYWDVPWRHGRDPHADPEMLRLETDHAAEFGRRYAKETAILAWDLTDEPPFWIVANSTTDAVAVNWTRLIAGAIRKNDKKHPIVVGVSTQDMGHGPFRPDVIADEVDFLSVHPYTIYTPDLFPDPMVSERGTYGAAFETTLSGGAGKPVMVQELGASSAQYTPEKVAEFNRLSLYSSLGAGANGFLLWCYTDAAPDQFHKVPYLRSPHETQFGLTTWDRKDRPQGIDFKKFEKIVGQMNFDGLSAAHADVGIVIPEEWSRKHGDYSRFGLTGPESIPYVSTSENGAVNGQAPGAYDGNQWLMSSVLSSFILSHRAGLKPAMPREYADWNKYPLVFLPSPLTGTNSIFVHVHSDFWTKAEAYVKDGGVLYASLSADGAIPEMQSIFGARMTDAVPVSEVTLKIVKPFGDLKPGDSFHFSAPGAAAKYWGAGLEIHGGDVIAVDQDGRPALVVNKLGKGKTLLSAYPLEAYLGNQPVAFEKNETAYRLFRALRAWGGIRAVASTDDPSVEVNALTASGGGYFVLVNHSPEARKVHLTTKLRVDALKRITESGTDASVQRDGDGWAVEMPALSGAVLAWGNR
jgi:endo-1,4-beta-mannosidase